MSKNHFITIRTDKELFVQSDIKSNEKKEGDNDGKTTGIPIDCDIGDMFDLLAKFPKQAHVS